MLTLEKVEIIYQMIIGHIRLSKYNLNLRRITDLEIDELVDMNIIEQVGEEEYRLLYAKGLYNYGIKLLNDRFGKYASNCFYKAYELDSDDRDICLQYINELIRCNNYDKALEIYKKITINFKDENIKEDNFYLCLFSRLMIVDSELANQVKTFGYRDLFLEESKENKVDNEIRKNVLQSKYTYACGLVNAKIRNSRDYNAGDMLVKTMLSHIIDKDKKDKKDIVCYAKEERYDLIIEMLEKIKVQKNLSRVENSVEILCEVLLNAINDNEIEYNDYSDVNDINNVHDAILVRDYRLALYFNIEFLDYIKENKEDDILYILLSKINMLVEKFKEEKNIELENNVFEEIELLDVSLDMEKIIKDAEEWAYYFKEQPIELEQAMKKTGLFTKYALLVKLVLARDCYISGNYSNGDRFLAEVERCFLLDKEVEIYLEEVKTIRNSNGEYHGFAKRLVK